MGFYMNRVVKNASWIIGCRIIQLFLSLILTMLTARFLGPANYGVLNYAISVTAFFVPIALLGINSVLVQELVSYPEEEGRILGSSLILGLISSVLCVLGVILFVSIANNNEPDTIFVCGLYSLMMVFQVLELMQYWFQAKLLSKYTSVISLIAYFIVSSYKFYLLSTNKGIRFFALAYSLDYLIISVGLLVLYCFRKDTQKLQFSKTIAKRIINKSKYYILSSLMVTLFAQQDKVMIKMLIGNEATGLYSAAVTIVTMSGFVFVAVIDSVRPTIYESKQISEHIYEDKIIGLYSIIIYMCLIQGIIFNSFADIIINVVYGNKYDASVPALKILVWYSSFSYIGGVRDIWLLAENKQKYLVLINIIGASINLLLNAVLIKTLGICGAAIASLITQAFTNIILTFFIKPIRRNNYFVFKALNPKYAVEIVKKHIE